MRRLREIRRSSVQPEAGGTFYEGVKVGLDKNPQKLYSQRACARTRARVCVCMRDTILTQPPLPGIDPPTLPGRFVNADMVIHEQDGLCVAMVRGSPFNTWPVGDLVAQNLFVVQARVAQVATIEELAAALDRPARTLYLALKQYTGGGAAALTPNFCSSSFTSSESSRTVIPSMNFTTSSLVISFAIVLFPSCM